MNPSTGQTLWSHPHRTDYGLNISTPVWSAADHLLFVSDYELRTFRRKIGERGAGFSVLCCPHEDSGAAPAQRVQHCGRRKAALQHRCVGSGRPYAIHDVVSRLADAYGDSMKDGNYSDLIFGKEYYTVAAPFE